MSKPRPGQPISGAIRAKDFADLLEMNERDKRRNRQEAGPIELPGCHPVIVKARVTSSGEVRRGSWYTIAGPRYDPSEDDVPGDGGPWQFKDGYLASTGFDLDEAQPLGRLIATSRDCPMMALGRRGEFHHGRPGRFLTAGMARTQIYFPEPKDTSFGVGYRRRYRTAGFESGVADEDYIPVARDDNLGPLKILWHEDHNWTEAGLQWAVVHFPHFGGYDQYMTGCGWQAIGGFPQVIDGSVGVNDWQELTIGLPSPSLSAGGPSEIDDASFTTVGGVTFRRAGSRMVHLSLTVFGGDDEDHNPFVVRMLNDGNPVGGALFHFVAPPTGTHRFGFHQCTFRASFGPDSDISFEMAALHDMLVYSVRLDLGPICNVSH